MSTSEAAMFVLGAVVLLGVYLVVMQAPPRAAIRRTSQRTVLAHCFFCGRRIWPWQRRGWCVKREGVVSWHGACWRRAHA